MRFLEVEQGSREWHELRSRSIGGSDVPILMGESKWKKTPYTLYVEKKSGRIEPPKPWMQRGIDLEPVARRAAEPRLGPLTPCVVQHDVYTWAIASLDGITIDGRPVEIKCPGKKDHSTALEGRVPVHYKGQLQQALWVTGADLAYYISFDGSQAEILEHKADPEYQDAMFRVEQDFARCLQNGVAPALLDKDVLPISDEEAERAAKARAEYKRQIKQLEILVDECDAKLVKEAIKRGSALKGYGVTITQCSTRRLDRQRLVEETGIDLEKYMIEGETKWRVRG